MSRITSLLRDSKLSPSEIAIKAQLPAQRVLEILDGREASLTELRAISRVLRIPLRSFVSEDSSDLNLLFRSSAASRPDRGVEAAAEFVQAALSILPARDSPPDWLSTFVVGEEDYSEAERAAGRVRAHLAPNRPDEPLIDLPELIVDHGRVILGRLETSRFEGASVIADGYPFIFVSARFDGRMLFTLAHEVGHLIAHHGANRAVVFDLATQIGGYRRGGNAESFVNAFASILLMPARGVGLALRQIRKHLEVNAESIGDIEILYLARFFGVSFEVSAQRCEQLELLPRGGARSLSEYLRDHHGGPERRAAALNLPPRPRVNIPRVSDNLLEVAVDSIKRGEVSVGWVADKFGLTINEVYAFHSQPEAFGGLHN